jgi:hypothetical protein
MKWMFIIAVAGFAFMLAHAFLFGEKMDHPYACWNAMHGHPEEAVWCKPPPEEWCKAQTKQTEWTVWCKTQPPA